MQMPRASGACCLMPAPTAAMTLRLMPSRSSRLMPGLRGTPAVTMTTSEPAASAQLEVPVTVHVAMGTDIIHIHPSVDGGAIGKAGHYDFRVFCRLVSELEGGVYLNVGSAVLLPEVFLKALTVARNLGHQVKRFTTANFDFIRHYRPATNVVHRPTLEGGKGFNFTGHHELMVPLLAAALIDAVSDQIDK